MVSYEATLSSVLKCNQWIVFLLLRMVLWIFSFSKIQFFHKQKSNFSRINYLDTSWYSPHLYSEDELGLFCLELSSRADNYLAVVFAVVVVVVVFEVLAAVHLDVFFKWYDLKCWLRTLLVQRFSPQSVYSEYYY